MFRWFSVKKYMNKLNPLLKKRYGVSEFYSAGQIERTIIECGFSKKYLPYAFAIFLSEDDFMRSVAERYPGMNPKNIRKYIAKRYFGGDLDYSYRDAVKLIVGNSSHTSIDHYWMGD